MTLVKDGLKYEATPIKKAKGGTVKRALLSDVDHLSTPTILWFLVKRHKVGILGTWAVVMSILYFFPFVPSLIFSAILGY